MSWNSRFGIFLSNGGRLITNMRACSPAGCFFLDKEDKELFTRLYTVSDQSNYSRDPRHVRHHDHGCHLIHL